jgi:hypothetical protein
MDRNKPKEKPLLEEMEENQIRRNENPQQAILQLRILQTNPIETTARTISG